MSTTRRPSLPSATKAREPDTATPHALPGVSKKPTSVGAVSRGLRVIDITNPTTPIEVGFYESLGIFVQGVVVLDSFAYLADYWGCIDNGSLRVININDPTNPTEVGFVCFQDYAYGIHVAILDSFAYVAGEDGGLRVIDVSVPITPTEVGIFDEDGRARGVAVSGNFAYAVNWDGLTVVDVTDPTVPQELGSVGIAGGPVSVAVSGSYAYVADEILGLHVVDVADPSTPIEVALVEIWDTYNWDVAVQDSFAYLANDAGLWVIDITDPTTPSAVGSLYTMGSVGVFGIAVSGSYAYLADWDSLLRVVDITDPTTPIEVGFLNTGVATWDVAVSGSFAYVAVEDRGLWVVDITDPTTPAIVGSLSTPVNASAVAVSGNFAYVGQRSFGLKVVDITDPTTPTEAGFYDTPWRIYDLEISGGLIFVADGLSLEILRNQLVVGFEESPIQYPKFIPLRLYQNQPNPFRNSTLIRYALPGISSQGSGVSERIHVSLSVYDITGRMVETLVDANQKPNTYTIQWEGNGRSSGVYFYRLTARGLDKSSPYTMTKKMILLR